MAFSSNSGKLQAVGNHDSVGLSNENRPEKLIEAGKENQVHADVDIAARAVEWGHVVKSESGEGSSVIVGVRSSGEESKSRERSVKSIKTSDAPSSESESNVPHISEEVKGALSTLQQTFVISDATRPDCPIMYASSGFFSMTGYPSKEVIGKNCRFLQGPDTDQMEVEKIREAVRTGKSYCGRLLNYKKDGTLFWNLLTITPISDDSGKVIKFIGMQVEVSKYTEGLNDKALRPNALPLSLIRYDARQKDSAKSSITEVVQMVKQPRRHSQTASQHQKLGNSPIKNNAAFGKVKVPDKQDLFDVQCSSSMLSSSSDHNKCSRKSARTSLFGSSRRFLLGLKGATPISDDNHELTVQQEIMMRTEFQHTESWELLEREKDIRQGIDLATRLERIEKNFVIADARLPDNPIIFASDSFLELTEYTREEILGRNCRFLQGPDTDQETVSKIRDAVREQKEITVQLINYTKTGKKFWNLFHLQPMRDQKGELQYFIGVQLDGSGYVEPLLNRLSNKSEFQSSKLVKATAEDIDEAVRELPDANLRPEDLWEIHSQPVLPRPHKKNNASWIVVQKVTRSEKNISLNHFRPIKPLGCGDTGSVHLVELRGTGELFAMKAMDKSVMINRNKVHRACLERHIISLLDHPFLPTLYASFQTSSHVCLITDFYPGGELSALLDQQPMKIFKEEAARFYAAEVVVGLEYLHCLGIIHRDLKPENILLQNDGHIVLTDFDLSFFTSCKPQVLKYMQQRHTRKSKDLLPPIFVSEPSTQSNSFVGTEEYIAPEVITGACQTGAVDWWALGILLYEMMYGHTPFRGKNRQRTFTNILEKGLTFPGSIPVSLASRQLIHGLLQKDPNNRLGSTSGANEIKQHPFFQEINWPLIRCMMPPQLDVPLPLNVNEPNSKIKDERWDDEGAFVQPLEV
uniref:non-specific serine/threonine protein kinase n=1 Tax=Posidonia australis TaxID=55488 RepID=A0A126WVF3_9LILI|nr:putative LOV domain-containing protein [Posidonia australis]